MVNVEVERHLSSRSAFALVCTGRNPRCHGAPEDETQASLGKSDGSVGNGEPGEPFSQVGRVEYDIIFSTNVLSQGW
jgi:hypothetical protein